MNINKLILLFAVVSFNTIFAQNNNLKDSTQRAKIKVLNKGSRGNKVTETKPIRLDHGIIITN